MRQSLEKSIEFVAHDEPKRSAHSITIVWIEAGLDLYPIGLDYCVLDSMLLFPRGVVTDWVSIALRRQFLLHPNEIVENMAWRFRLGPDEAGIAIRQVAWLRRRRAKAEKNWESKKFEVTNRITRMTQRAMSLVEKEKKDAYTEIMAVAVAAAFGVPRELPQQCRESAEQESGGGGAAAQLDSSGSGSNC